MLPTLLLFSAAPVLVEPLYRFIPIPLLQADPSFVRATLPREQWREPEMGQPTLPLEFDYTPLHFAAAYGHIELARVLLAHGADVNDATPGETPLDRAVIMHDVPMATLLLEHEANPDHPAAAGLTALHRAAIRGHTEMSLSNDLTHEKCHLTTGAPEADPRG